MHVLIHPSADAANEAAAMLLTHWLTSPGVRTLMVAAGNTPLELYRRIAERKLQLSHLTVFALDEYVGVPLHELRNCANLLRRAVVEAWRIPQSQYFTISSIEKDALTTAREQERRITTLGGLDVIVLGLGQNGHLGFNEPGSAEDSTGRLLGLDPISIEANRKWFGGDYAPALGATVGLKTILAARRVLILAFGPHKTAAVKAMVEGLDGQSLPSFVPAKASEHAPVPRRSGRRAVDPKCPGGRRSTAALRNGRTWKSALSTRRSLMNHTSPAEFTALGIDVGGTKIAAGIVSFPTGQVRKRRLIPTTPARGGEMVLDDVTGLAEALIADAKSAGLRVEDIGVGLCELVAPSGRILSANCVQWQDQPVRERLSHLGRVKIEADVRAAALAEAIFGAGKPFEQFLYVTVGTGISCCLVLEGKPFTGARGAAGTMASSPVSVACELCGHVSRRTLEEISSGPALVARLNQRRLGSATSGEDVFAAAAAGQTDAVEIVRSAGVALGTTVGLLVNVLDPEAIVIGGGLGLCDGLYWETFITAVRRQIWSDIHRDLPIVHAATGLDAGLIGAAAVAWKE